MRKFLLAAVLTGAVLLGGVQTALAEHTNDHRYYISGKVVDKKGTAWAGETVIISAPTAGVNQEVQTNGAGKFEAKLHLHDQNKGEEVTVTAAGVTKTHIIDLKVGDTNTVRRGVVNITTTADAKSEGGGASSILPWAVAGIIVAGIGGAIYATYPRKSKAPEKPQSKKSGTKSKSGSSKKKKKR